MDGIEDVEACLDEIRNQRLNCAAGVDECLPLRMSVNPTIDPAVEGLKQIAISVGRQERRILRAEVRAGHEDHGDPVSHGLPDEFQVSERDLALAFEDFLHVLSPCDRADVPLRHVPNALRVLQERRGHERDIAEPGAAEVCDDGVRGVLMEVVRGLAQVFQVVVPDRLELLEVVLHLQVRIVNGRLAHDGVEVEPVFGHAAAWRSGLVALRVHEDVAVRLGIGVELAGHEHGRAVECHPRLPVLVLEAEQSLAHPQPDAVNAQRLLEIVGDLAQHLVRLDSLHRLVRSAETEGLSQPAHDTDLCARRGRGAQINRRPVGFLMAQSGLHAFA